MHTKISSRNSVMSFHSTYFALFCVGALSALLTTTVGCEEDDTDADGWTESDGDCNDSNSSIHPGALETCDSLDNDCNGLIDDLDSDGDGISACDNDCDDNNPAIHPAATESCDGQDNNCDGAIDSGCPQSGGLNGNYLLSDSRFKKLVGPTYYQGAGLSVSYGGDVNGDNHGDLLIGAPYLYADTNGATSGFLSAVYIVHGPIDVPVDSQQSVASLQDAARLEGGYEGSSIGDTLAHADLDHDGIDEIITGSSRSMQGSTFLVTGPISPGQVRSVGNSEARFVGSSGQEAGASAILGDLNADQIMDTLVIGATGYSSSTTSEVGGVFVVNLDDISLHEQTYVLDEFPSLWGSSQDSCTGHSLSFNGDVNNDGMYDLLVGSPCYSQATGATYLVTASVDGELPTEAMLPDVGLSMVGEFNDSWSGIASTAMVDLNGDTIDDIVVGAPGNDSTHGRVYVVFGSIDGTFPSTLESAHLIIESANVGDQFGSSLSAGGDANHDGFRDLLIGAPAMRGTSGMPVGGAYLIHGPTTVTGIVSIAEVSSARFEDQSFDLAGTAVSLEGDITGDGVDDIVIGSPRNDDSGEYYSGAVFIIPGVTL